MLKFSILDLCSIIHKSNGRKLLIVGTDKCAYNCKLKMELLGFKITKYVDIGVEKYFEIIDEEIVHINQIINNKDEYYLILTEDKFDNIQSKYLLGFGFEYIKNFNFLQNARTQTKLDMRTGLDPNIGHASVSGNGLGCRIIGGYGRGDIKIAINGASLVDENCFDWKLWPEQLYDMLKNKGESVCVLNYASYGYTTSQCLIKFIRDIIPEKPDILIDYFPWENDAFYGECISTPYIVGYQKKAFDILKGKIISRYERNLVDEIELGNVANKDSAEVIANNFLITRSLCKQFGIKYICVLPPSSVTKKIICKEDMETRWSLGKKIQIVERVCDKALKKMYEYGNDSILDARCWVDDYENIIFDQFHMYEEGNKIIAKKMLERIYAK